MPVLLDEQKRFATVLDSLRELCSALDAGVGPLPARLDPSALTDELGGVLAEHFESAEQCLQQVAARRPDLLPAVVDMRSDHTALSQSLADLRLVVADPARWSDLPSRIGALLGTLSVHRECEAALVRAAARTQSGA